MKRWKQQCVIDICSFTSISETEPADTVVKLLNNYFDVMVKEIIAQGGYIDKFIGDAVMAVFRGEFHLDRAIEACLAVRSTIENCLIEDGIISFTPKVSIGINSGEMISGNIGSANLRRLDYTVDWRCRKYRTTVAIYGQGRPDIITESSYEKVKESFQLQ